MLPLVESEPDHESSRAELNELKQQLTELRQKLAESQRLGTISAMIVHEFNNLLTPVVGYSELALMSAQQQQPDMDLVCKALVQSYKSAERAGQICQSMLGLAKGNIQHEVVPVREIVDDCLRVLAPDLATDKIALQVQVPPELRVAGDAIQIGQVLLNLVINARQAMYDTGGSLTIKAERVAEAGEVKIQVSDTGPGISKSIQRRVFEPFFTTKKAAREGQKHGMGLGLHICKEIVELHHGRIELQSEEGRGATFTVVLTEAAT